MVFGGCFYKSDYLITLMSKITLWLNEAQMKGYIIGHIIDVSGTHTNGIGVGGMLRYMETYCGTVGKDPWTMLLPNQRSLAIGRDWRSGSRVGWGQRHWLFLPWRLVHKWPYIWKLFVDANTSGNGNSDWKYGLRKLEELVKFSCCAFSPADDAFVAK